ncbi:MAG: hypothetical protein ACR2NN_09705 [Bryobacteraceae bacterium]
MTNRGTPAKGPRTIKTPGDSELWDFLDQQPGNGVIAQPPAPNPPARNGSLDSMLLEYWDQPNEMQLNIRLPAAAKKMIERLARRKTVGVSTLVRMWVIECLRREARQL